MINKIFRLIETKNGICDFWINKVDKQDRITKNTIKYNKWLDYKQILEKVYSFKRTRGYYFKNDGSNSL